MNPILLQLLINMGESIGIPVLLGTIQTEIKDPATAAQYRQSLLVAADAIYTAFGITPPTHG